MTPAEELVIHLINLAAAARFIFLTAARDATLLKGVAEPESRTWGRVGGGSDL
jgi:hypothetical protein